MASYWLSIRLGMSHSNNSFNVLTSSFCDSDLYDDTVDNRSPVLQSDDTIHVYGEHGELIEYRHD